jgi:transcriptional regulator with XRE-family HTH domain
VSVSIDPALENLLVPRENSSSEQSGIGVRLARLRKEAGLTQVELAEKLDVPQSMVSDYEREGLRLHAELLIQLCQILKVSADEILGLAQSSSPPPKQNRRLYRKLKDIDRLPKRDQEALLRTIDAFLSRS